MQGLPPPAPLGRGGQERPDPRAGASDCPHCLGLLGALNVRHSLPGGTLLVGPHQELGLVGRSEGEEGRVGEGQLPGAGGTQASPPPRTSALLPARCFQSLGNYPIYKYRLRAERSRDTGRRN